MASSRRRACQACIRSKRRCEQGQPRCRRCQARRLDCIYAEIAVGPSTEQASGYQEDDAFPDEVPGDLLPRQSGSSELAMLSPYMNEAFFEFCNEPFNLPSLPHNCLFDPSMIEDIMVRPERAEIEQIGRDADMRSRVEFVSKRLARLPKLFVERAQTTFVHRSLLQARPAPELQDALSVCALYCFQNARNQMVVTRTLEHKSRELITKTNNPQVATRRDLLAAAQSLLIYQLIRLFDGDIRLRVQAEEDEPILMAWVSQLRCGMHQLSPATSYPLTPCNTTDWYQWLFEESLRRTVITAYVVKGIYNYLKTGHDTEQDIRLSFTAQKALWNAQSEYGWTTARNELERLEIRVAHWDEDIAKATARDMEELGVQIMIMFKGVNGTAQWVGKDHHAEYGLEWAQE